VKKLMLIAGIAALAACGQKEAAPAENADMNAAEANMEAPAATPAAFQLNETSWTFTDKDGQAIQESIDANGNYIANSGEKHVDHGTSVMKDDKACFTSAMNKDGETCWTTKPLEIGQSFETTSDKGEKLTVTRVAYTPLTMPAG
jgi:hypothetical protein